MNILDRARLISQATPEKNPRAYLELLVERSWPAGETSMPLLTLNRKNFRDHYLKYLIGHEKSPIPKPDTPKPSTDSPLVIPKLSKKRIAKIVKEISQKNLEKGIDVSRSCPLYLNTEDHSIALVDGKKSFALDQLLDLREESRGLILAALGLDFHTTLQIEASYHTTVPGNKELLDPPPVWNPHPYQATGKIFLNI